MRTWTWYSKLLLVLVLAAFAYWVWPTPWKTYKTGRVNLRVNRFTGHTQRLWSSGWSDPDSESQAAADSTRIGSTRIGSTTLGP